MLVILIKRSIDGIPKGEEVPIAICDKECIPRVKMLDILIINGDSVYLRSVTRVLRSRGCAVNIVSAVNGEKALAFLKTIMVDVVVMDLNMTDMDCYQLLRHLQQYYPLIKTIVLSDHFQKYPDSRLQRLEFVLCVEKSNCFEKIAKVISGTD